MSLASYDTLLKALKENNIEEFETILKREGLPGDGLDRELLREAINLDNKPICHLLLDNDCSVCEFKDGIRKCAPLNSIIFRKKIGWHDVAEKILRNGARVTDTCNDGDTVLHDAFHFYYRTPERAVVELLLNHFLQETNQDLKSTKKKLRCIHIASAMASVDCVKRCLALSNVNVQIPLPERTYVSFAGYTPLHFAVENDRLDVAEFLCQNNADLYLQNRFGSTPIHLALERRNIEMIDVLFRYDKKHKNFVNRFGLTHFMAACAGSNTEVVKQYLDSIEEDPSMTIEKLISDRVSMELYNPNGEYRFYRDPLRYHPFAGYSAFYFAVEFSNAKNLPLLLDRGAYCKLKKLTFIKVDCDVRRGIIFGLIRKHYAQCHLCKRRNFVYKRLACSNRGIEFLNDVDCVQRCMSSSCMKNLYIYMSIFMLIVVIIVILAKLQDDTPKETTTLFPPIPTYRPWSYRSYRF